MAEPWKVVQATGQRIDLERGLERMEIPRPTDPWLRQVFVSIVPGTLVDDATIDSFMQRGKRK